MSNESLLKERIEANRILKAFEIFLSTTLMNLMIKAGNLMLMSAKMKLFYFTYYRNSNLRTGK